MNHFISLLVQDSIFTLFFLSFLFLFFLFFTFIIQYIYLNRNIKGVCRIIFNDENAYRIPLEPFGFYFLSCLPLVFWRETLNAKKGVKFKKLYEKQFYFKIEKNQLTKLIKQYPYFFIIQYVLFLFGIFWLVLLVAACFLDNFI